MYFAPQVREALTAAGMRGFWMGYFAGRAAPLGRVPAEVVEAVFYNFAPRMVRRAIPDAWTYAPPEALLRVRMEGAVEALRGVAGDGDAERPAELLQRVARACPVAGRPLFAAYAALPWPDDALASIWHAATLLREHRGDGHNAALLAAGIGGCESHALKAAAGAVPRPVLQGNRGWTDEEWAAAEAALRDRGLMVDDRLTRDGAALVQWIERRTDEAAAAPWGVLDELERLYDWLEPAARAVVRSALIPFPNPMGLPRLPDG